MLDSGQTFLAYHPDVFDFNDTSLPNGAYRLETAPQYVLNSPPGIDPAYGTVLVMRGSNNDTLAMMLFTYVGNCMCFKTTSIGLWTQTKWKLVQTTELVV